MAKNRNFDEVRVGTVVGFDHVTLHGHEYKCSYAGAVFRDFFPENLTLAKDGWEAVGGYIVSQPKPEAQEQPTALDEATIRDKALEDAARVCESEHLPDFSMPEQWFNDGCKACAAAIRQMKGQHNPPLAPIRIG